MIRESIAIMVVLLLLAGILARTKNQKLALVLLPLALLPLCHLIISSILHLTKGYFFGIRPAIVVAFVDVLALVVTGALIILFGARIPTRKIRTLYLIMMFAYTVGLGWAYIFTTLEVLFI